MSELRDVKNGDECPAKSKNYHQSSSNLTLTTKDQGGGKAPDHPRAGSKADQPMRRLLGQQAIRTNGAVDADMTSKSTMANG
ncbi:hypothetical protein ACX0GZ_14095 [Sphingomonas aestuarii]